MEQLSSHDRRVFRRYHAELFATLLLYAVVLIVALDMGRPMHRGLEKTVVLVTPMGPFLLMIWVIARQLQRVDEYIRLKILENLAWAAAVTATATFTYGFLENAGYPKVTMFTVWPIMGGAWFLITILRCAFDR
jgi:amino acid transporter